MVIKDVNTSIIHETFCSITCPYNCLSLVELLSIPFAFWYLGKFDGASFLLVGDLQALLANGQIHIVEKLDRQCLTLSLR